jgi:hypothetical protein
LIMVPSTSIHHSDTKQSLRFPDLGTNFFHQVKMEALVVRKKCSRPQLVKRLGKARGTVEDHIPALYGREGRCLARAAAPKWFREVSSG